MFVGIRQRKQMILLFARFGNYIFLPLLSFFRFSLFVFCLSVSFFVCLVTINAYYYSIIHKSDISVSLSFNYKLNN